MSAADDDGVTRAEHLAWCKQRALEYVDRARDSGELAIAWASMTSDLTKHSQTAAHPAIQLGTALLIAGHLSTRHQMRTFIEEVR